MATPLVQVLILGHSFTRRLRDWSYEHSCLNLNLDRDRVTVFWHGKGGATVLRHRPGKMLWDKTQLISDLNSDIVFLDIGSNDFSYRKNDWLTPQKLAECIVNFAYECIRLGARQVIISEILPRRNTPYYNERVVQVNDILSNLLRDHGEIYFWQHRHNNFSTRFLDEYVHGDGIHIDEIRGMARYFSSVRGAVIFLENRLNQ